MSTFYTIALVVLFVPVVAWVVLSAFMLAWRFLMFVLGVLLGLIALAGRAWRGELN